MPGIFLPLPLCDDLTEEDSGFEMEQTGPEEASTAGLTTRSFALARRTGNRQQLGLNCIQHNDFVDIATKNRNCKRATLPAVNIDKFWPQEADFFNDKISNFEEEFDMYEELARKTEEGAKRRKIFSEFVVECSSSEPLYELPNAGSVLSNSHESRLVEEIYGSEFALPLFRTSSNLFRSRQGKHNLPLFDKVFHAQRLNAKDEEAVLNAMRKKFVALSENDTTFSAKKRLLAECHINVVAGTTRGVGNKANRLRVCDFCWRDGKEITYKDPRSSQYFCTRACQVRLRMNRDPLGIEGGYSSRDGNTKDYQKWCTGKE